MLTKTLKALFTKDLRSCFFARSFQNISLINLLWYFIFVKNDVSIISLPTLILGAFKPLNKLLAS